MSFKCRVAAIILPLPAGIPIVIALATFITRCNAFSRGGTMRSLRGGYSSIALVALVFGASTLSAQPTSRTLQRTASDQMVPAKVEDLAWLAGVWRGSTPGVVIEETWTPPSGNSLQGMFKYVKDGATVLYELFVIVPDSGGLSLRLKHFHADLRGWEERNDMRRFVLLRHAPGLAEFDGMTYALVGKDTLRAIVAMRQSDGSRKEEEFTYLRVR